MPEKLDWKEIQQRYSGEWVELTDYEWQEGEPYPSAGVVRVHGSERKEFYKLANDERPSDSAILFVGEVSLPFGAVRNNLTKISRCK